MSWSVSAMGKAAPVRDSIAKQFAGQGKCSEPEETIRLAAAKLLDDALAAHDVSIVVVVSASGSQSYKDWSTKTGVSNSMSISIQPQYGFVE